MAKSIGKFAVNIGAVTTGFSKGIKNSSKLSTGFGKNLGGLAIKVAGVAAAFLAFKKGIGAVLAQFDDIDKIAKFSKQTGLATESLVALGHAGELSGVSGETVNKAVQRMTRNLGEAKAGIATARKGFDQLGLSVDDLSGMSPEEQFGAIADKIKAIKDPAQRAAAAYAVFGRSGQDMIPMLEGGSAAMEAARREASDLGLSFSAIDAAKIEDANDAWHRVKSAVTGVVRMFAAHLAPVFTAISDKLVVMAKKVVAGLKSWAPLFGEWTQAMVGMIDAVFSAVMPMFESARSGLGAMGSAISAVTGELGNLGSQAGAVSGSLLAVGDAGRLDAARKGFGELGLSVENLARMSPEDQYAAIAEKINAIKDPAERAAAAQRALGESGLQMMQGTGGGLQSLGSRIVGLIKEWTPVVARFATRAAQLIKSIFVRAVPIIEQVIVKVSEVVSNVVRVVTAWLPVIRQFANVVATTFQMVLDAATQIFEGVSEAIVGPMGSAKDVVLDMMIALEFNIKNFGTIAEVAFLKAHAGVLAFAGGIKHFFVGVLPALFDWFVDNWQGIWRTALDFVLTGFINLGKNIRAVFSSVWEFMKTGNWEVALVPLTEGFKNMIQKLPEIPERQMGTMEQTLREEAVRIEAKLDSDFKVFHDKRRAELLESSKPAELPQPVIESPTLELTAPLEVDLGGDEKSDTKGAAGGTAALQRGSAAAFSAIAKQIRGASEQKRQKKILDAGEASAEHTERTADAVEAMAEALKPVTPVVI